jgi:hypothetical protein
MIAIIESAPHRAFTWAWLKACTGTFGVALPDDRICPMISAF